MHVLEELSLEYGLKRLVLVPEDEDVWISMFVEELDVG